MQYRMDVNTSPFDVALAELTRRNASSPVPLLEYDDGEVYAMEQMAMAAGIAALKPNRTLFADLVRHEGCGRSPRRGASGYAPRLRGSLRRGIAA